MANNHGGQRTPRNPAPVSGPGKLSQRTDGGPQQVQAQLKGQAYGDSQRLNELQSAAPLAASSTSATPRGRAQSQAAQSATPLFSPTANPDEPVTAGAPFGPGDGPSPSGFGATSAKELPDLKARFMPALLDSANKPNMPPSFVAFVRTLRDT